MQQMKKPRPSAAPRSVAAKKTGSPPAAPSLPAVARDALAAAAEFEREQKYEEALVKYSLALSHEPRLVHAWIRLGYIFLVGLHWQRGI